MSGGNIDYSFLRKKLEKEATDKILADPEFDRYVRSFMKVAAKSTNDIWRAKAEYDAAVAHLLPRKVEIYVNGKIHNLERETQKPIGPRMIQGGREDGYLNKKIMKALKIAQEGKTMGAEFISAA